MTFLRYMLFLVLILFPTEIAFGCTSTARECVKYEEEGKLFHIQNIFLDDWVHCVALFKIGYFKILLYFSECNYDEDCDEGDVCKDGTCSKLTYYKDLQINSPKRNCLSSHRFKNIS